jgi:hypothetical protein
MDPHGHLYDAYSVKAWCRAAVTNLAAGSDALAVVVVVDRQNQDSLARLRREVPSFGSWKDLPGSLAGMAEVDGQKLLVVQGVQYVSLERIEVLGLGVGRVLSDGLTTGEYIDAIIRGGGVPCLPWSPGKWLGARGRVVKTLLETHSPSTLAVGDIAIRSVLGPPSALLRYARQRGYRVFYGTDPLPSPRDESLVGTFGVEISGISFSDECGRVDTILEAMRSPEAAFKQLGKRNSGCRAVGRFVGQFLGL